MDAAVIQSELDKFYDGYVSAYNNGDLDTYCACFSVPLSTLSGGVSQIFMSPAEVRGSAEAQQRSFTSSNWSHSVVVAKRVWVIDPGLAVIAADLQRVNISGEVYQTGRCVYSVARQEGRWKIVTITQSVEALPSSNGLLEPPADAHG